MWKWILALCVASTVTMTLSAETNVLAFSGSTRVDSDNKKLVAEAAEIARQAGAKVTVIDLKDLPMPFYDADLEAKQGMPLNAKKLRQLMMQSQVILIASPEYNGSLSGVLKNAIDWASRDEKGGSSRDAFKGKTFVIMAASAGQSGGARGLVHLRTILENIGATVVTQQVTVPNAYDAFDAQGKLKDPKTRSDLEQLVKQAVSNK